MGRNDDSRASSAKWLLAVTTATVVAAMVLVNAVAAQAQAPSISDSRVAPGETVTVSGNGCTSTEAVSYFVDVRLVNGSGAIEDSNDVSADADGDWTAQLTVPSSLADGTYDITSKCEGRDGSTVLYSKSYGAVSLTVAEPTPEPTPEPTTEPEPTATPTEEALATPTPTDEAEPTNTPVPADPEIKLSSSGGRAPFTTTVSGTACVDDDDTEVELRIINDDKSRALTAKVDSDGDWSESLSFSADEVGNNSIKASCVTDDDTLFKYTTLTVTVGSPTLSSAEGSLSAEQTKINTGDKVKAKATKCPSDSDDDADDFRVRFTLTYQGTDDSWSESEFGSGDGDGNHTVSITVDNDAPVGTYLLAANCEEKQSDGSFKAVEEYTDLTVTVFATSATPTATPAKTTPTAIPTPTPDDIDIGFTG